MRIAIVRGDNLNKFEMQCYEPLTKEHEITAYTTWCHSFDVQNIELAVKRLPSPSLAHAWLPQKLGRLAAAVLNRSLAGAGEYMVGLESELRSYDIIHTAETYNAYTYQALRVKSKFGCRVVVTVWENIPFNFEEHPLNRSIKNRARRQADFFVAITQRAADALVLEGVSPSKIAVIPVGIDLDRFRPEEKPSKWLRRLGLKNSDFVILFIGRLIRDKGVYDLLFSVKKLHEDPELSDYPLKLLLVGRGPERSRLGLLTTRLGLESTVSTVSGVPYSQVPQLHNLADVFVLPSTVSEIWQEQLGMVLIESMACGKPVVSTLSGSIPEVVEDAGCLVQPGDPFSLSETLKGLILDADLREELGARARQRVETRFNAMISAQNLNELYSCIS